MSLDKLRWIRLDRHYGWTLVLNVDDGNGSTHTFHKRFDPGDSAADVAMRLAQISGQIMDISEDNK